MAYCMDIDSVMKILKKEVKEYQVPIVDLIKIQTKDPFKVLVTTILSARTNDKTTSQVAKRLFSKVRDPEDLEKISLHQLEKQLFPVGFYKNKARFLKQLPKTLKKFGKVPDNLEDLLKLPGVGRKTANLVLAIAFEIPAICVDTHVHRITNRWGYVKTRTPFETEMALRKKLPKKHWLDINSTLVAFGQNLCRPLNPRCKLCKITRYCDYFNNNKKKIIEG